MSNTKVTTVLTILGAIGVGVTAVLSSKNAISYEIVKKELNEDASKLDKTKAFAKAYWPTVLAGSLTIGCIVGSQVLNVKEIAAATTAVGVVGAKYNELCKELKEKHPDIYKEVQEDIRERHIKEEFEKNPGVRLDRKPYYLAWSDQLFWATEAEVLQSECYLNEVMMNTGEATLYDYVSSYPKECGLECKNWMKFIGWYEGGDTTYSYNAGYFGLYLKPEVCNQRIELDDEYRDVNVINWLCDPDGDPSLDENELANLEYAIINGTDI